MKKTVLSIICLLISLCLGSLPAVAQIYVDDDGSDGNGGTGWGDAYATLSNGIANASAG